MKTEKNLPFTRITFTTKFEKYVNSRGQVTNSLVYKDKSYFITDASQISILAMSTKGSPVIRVSTTNAFRPKNESEFNSFVSIMNDIKDFQLIECGKSSMRKDLVCVDIDGGYTNEEFFEKIKAMDLPDCILTKNIITSHWQILFLLKNPIFTKRISWKINENGNKYPEIIKNENNQLIYMKTVKRFTEYFKKFFPETDINYKGTFCRNPMNELQESYWLINKNLQKLSTKDSNLIYFEDLIKFLDKNKVELRKNVNLTEPEVKEKCEMMEFSRHNMEVQYSREYMWHNMRHGCTPSINNLREYLLQTKYEIADICGKEPHSDKEIIGQVESLYQWAIDNFNDIGEKGNQKEFSIEYNKQQHAQKIKNAAEKKIIFLKLMENGIPLKEIAKALDMSRVTLYTYLPLFYVIDLIQTRFYFKDSWLKYGANKSWEEIFIEIGNKIKELKMKCGDSKIKWKGLNYNKKCEDWKYVTNYNNLFVNVEDELRRRFVA